MAIQISNFNPVWKYNENENIPVNPLVQYYDATYMFVQCNIVGSNTVNIIAELWDKKPITTIEVINEFETRVTYDNGAQKINNLNFGVIETNVEGNILLASHEAIVTKLSGLNPTAAFNIIDLLGSVV
jgi:hypothetical protein